MDFSRFKTNSKKKSFKGQTHLLTHVYDIGEDRIINEYSVRKLVLCSVWKKRKKDGQFEFVFEQKILNVQLYEDSDLWKLLIALGEKEEELPPFINCHKDPDDRNDLANQVLQKLKSKLFHYFSINIDWRSRGKNFVSISYIGKDVPDDIKYWKVKHEQALKLSPNWKTYIGKKLTNAKCITGVGFVDMHAFYPPQEEEDTMSSDDPDPDPNPSGDSDYFTPEVSPPEEIPEEPRLNENDLNLDNNTKNTIQFPVIDSEPPDLNAIIDNN